MTILPEGDDIRKAVKWIDEMRHEKPKKPLPELICEAALKFDLPPKDQEFLTRNFCKKE